MLSSKIQRATPRNSRICSYGKVRLLCVLCATHKGLIHGYRHFHARSLRDLDSHESIESYSQFHPSFHNGTGTSVHGTDLICVSYLTALQYNALVDLASSNGSFYSPIWTGPPLNASLPWGQLCAMDVLNAAIGMSSLNRCAQGQPPQHFMD